MVTCDRFLDDYSSFRDGVLPMWERVGFRAHLEECASCAKYDRVVREGTALLRGLPQLEVSDDFAARLQHRVWHEDLDRLEHRRRAHTLRFAGFTAMAAAVAGLAVGLSLKPAAGGPGAGLARESAGVGSYVVDHPHPEAGRVTSELARLGVRLYELPYHDVVYRPDATLVASLAAYDAQPEPPNR